MYDKIHYKLKKKKKRERDGFNLWIGKLPWRRAWQPTQVFLHG